MGGFWILILAPISLDSMIASFLTSVKSFIKYAQQSTDQTIWVWILYSVILKFVYSMKLNLLYLLGKIHNKPKINYIFYLNSSMVYKVLLYKGSKFIFTKPLWIRQYFSSSRLWKWKLKELNNLSENHNSHMQNWQWNVLMSREFPSTHICLPFCSSKSYHNYLNRKNKPYTNIFTNWG